MFPLVFLVRSLDAVFSNNYMQGRSGGARVHQGIDIGVVRDGRRRSGDIIVSGTPGRVATVRRETRPGEPRSGNSVTVRDPDGWMHHYAHMDGAPFVSRGQTVDVGTPLGKVGNSGNARNTAAHLHYHLEASGERRNPYPALASAFAAMRTGQLPRAYLGDGAALQNDEAATPAQREHARESWRQLMPATQAVVDRLEGWDATLWDALTSLQDGERAAEARRLLAINLPIVKASLAFSRREATAQRWISAMVQLRTAATLLGLTLQPLAASRSQLPDEVRTMVRSVVDFAEFFVPGSMTNFGGTRGEALSNAFDEGRDDLNELAPDIGMGLFGVLLIGGGLYIASQSRGRR